jgi:hypothetical protein
MQIKDLAKTLSHEERAVRGGNGPVAVIGGQYASNSVSGFAFGSPQTNVQIGPTVTQTYDPVSLNLTSVTSTVTKNELASLIDSPFAFVKQ